MPDITRAISRLDTLTYGGSISAGGWDVSLTVLDDGDAFAKWDTLSISEVDHWGIGLDAEPTRHAFFGYILPYALVVDWDRSKLSALGSTSQGLLKDIILPRLSFKQTTSPGNPHDFGLLRLGHIVTHILEGHTNFVYDATLNPAGWITLDNVSLTAGDTFAYFSVQEGDIWSNIRRLADLGVLVAFFNKHDDLYFDVHPMFKSTLPDVVTHLDADLWFGENGFRPIPRHDVVRQVILSAETDTGGALTATYPTQAAFYGRDLKARTAANTQATLDAMAQRLQRFANRNWDLEIQTWLTDFELGDRIQITHSSAADGITWSNKDFYVESISVSYDFEAETRRVSLRLNEGV